MNYNPQMPIAVFLGPSLETAQASQLLAANYYPPARMGDIYRVLGAGVRMIILVDGIFHTELSVWQREILAALDNNITVIGAASMGALRAAELHSFGMIGHGTIFTWYRAGLIEGDDEVALAHADEEYGFQALSEPLVNIRYNLGQAVRQGVISPAHSAALIEYAQGTYYADRSYRLLFNSPVVKQWPLRLQERLIQFIKQKSVNLKRVDAVGALRYRATVAAQGNGQLTSWAPGRSQNRYYQLAIYHHRGFLNRAGYLVSGRALLAEASKDLELIKTYRPVLIKNHFLRLWAKQNNIDCPTAYVTGYQQQWAIEHIPAHPSAWLQANGLTAREFEDELKQRALIGWLVDQGPGYFGLDFEPYVKFIEAVLAMDAAAENGALTPDDANGNHAPERPAWFRQAAEICYLAAWAGENGVACPASRLENFIKTWEETGQIHDRANWLQSINLAEKDYLSILAAWAHYGWLIEKGPAYFGYTAWSLEVALLKELQITGQAAQLVEAASFGVSVE